MDSINAISILQAFKNTLQGQKTGVEGNIEAINVAFDLLNNGYKTDQARIDDEIAKAKEAFDGEVASLKEQIQSLTNDNASKDALIASEKARADAAEAKLVPPVVAALNANAEEAKAAIADIASAEVVNP